MVPYLAFFRDDEQINVHDHFPKNIWIGCTTEHQEAFDERMRHMQRIRQHFPHIILFLSMEPLLTDIDIRQLYGQETINWIIVGGESGDQARAMNPKYAWRIISACHQFSIPVFFKQWGEYRPIEEPGFYHPTRAKWAHIDYKRMGKGKAGDDFYGHYYKQFPKSIHEPQHSKQTDH